MISISEKIKCPINRVYKAFYDLHAWKNILNDVRNVDVFYDDGAHQYFSMTVERNNKEETVSGMRFCQENRLIELCQTTPPPGFISMHGVWGFAKAGEDTWIFIQRNFALIKPELKAEVSEKLFSYLENNLKLFKAYLENGND